MGVRSLARSMAAERLLCLVIMGLFLLPGCRELMERLDSGPERYRYTADEPEEHEPESIRTRLHEGLDLDRAKELLRKGEMGHITGPDLDPTTPAGRLKEEILYRLACETSVCRSSSLRRIRDDQDGLMPGLEVLLDGHGEDVGAEGVRLVGLLKHASAVPLLADRLVKTRSAQLRLELLWTLAEVGDARAFLALRRVAEEPRTLEEQRALCRAFRKLGEPAALDAIGRLYRSPDARVRSECVVAASATPDKQAIDLCTEALKDPDAGVREEARRCLASRPAPDALEAAEPASSDPVDVDR
jgi:hypothetical protein